MNEEHVEQQWERSKPLSGKRVMVTRARSQAQELSEMIAKLGGETYEFPLVKMIPLQNNQFLDQALSQIETFDWVIFTSANGVRFFFERMRELYIDIRQIKAKLAAVGPKTAVAIKLEGLEVNVLPSEFVAEGLLHTLENQFQTGEKVLLPRADIARKILPDELRRLGLEVMEVDAYETVVDAENLDEAVNLLQSREIQIVTFTSASTVKNFMQVMAEHNLETLLRDVQIACIGPITADTARALGLAVHVVPSDYTIEGLVEAIVIKLGGE